MEQTAQYPRKKLFCFPWDIVIFWKLFFLFLCYHQPVYDVDNLYPLQNRLNIKVMLP